MIGELQSIRQALKEALDLFDGMPDGRGWDGDLTDSLDESRRAMVIGSLANKIALLDKWLLGNWTDSEMITVLDLIERWHAEELVIERMRNRYPEDSLTDLAKIPLSGRPIPAIDIPDRPELPTVTGVVDSSAGDAAATANVKIVMPAQGPIPYTGTDTQ